MPGTMRQDRESLNLYLREIADSRPLSRQEEVALARQIRQGDREARDELVSANLLFVVRVAREYRNYGIPLPELISAGNVGLLTAAERFDETRGFKFISYAVWWIRQAIHRMLANDARLIRLPLNRVDLLHNIRRASKELAQARESEPDAEAIAGALGASVGIVKDTLMHSRNPRPLDTSASDDEGQALLDLLPDTTQRPPDAAAIEASTREQVGRMLDTLRPREAEVLRLCFGLGDREALTLEEIGLRFHVSRERVRQIKENALKKLRNSYERSIALCAD